MDILLECRVVESFSVVPQSEQFKAELENAVLLDVEGDPFGRAWKVVAC